MGTVALSQNSPVTRRDCRDLKGVSFPVLPVLTYHHTTKEGLTQLHPRHQISSVLPGTVWTVSVTLQALRSKCHFIGGEAGTEKQSIFFKVTGQSSGRAKILDYHCGSGPQPAPPPHTKVISSAEPLQDTVSASLTTSQATWFLDSSGVYRC